MFCRSQNTPDELEGFLTCLWEGGIFYCFRSSCSAGKAKREVNLGISWRKWGNVGREECGDLLGASEMFTNVSVFESQPG